jgi:D-alanyl-lipoteichoic acid acyltransferase DltB (MBOAT superfamily)
VRLVCLAGLFTILVWLNHLNIITLLAWTERVFPKTHYPWLFLGFLVTYAALPLLGTRARKAWLLGASILAAAYFSVLFALGSLLYFALYYRVVFSTLRPGIKLAFLLGTYACWVVLCNMSLFPGLLGRHPEIILFGYVFAVHYTFRLFYFHHEMHLKNYVRVPFVDFLLYFLFLPYFVIVPYMFSIPRFDRFTESLGQPPSTHAAGIRHVAAGILCALLCHGLITAYDVRVVFEAALRRGDWLVAYPAGLLCYPVFVVLRVVGTAYVLTGLLLLLGIRTTPPFSRPLASESVLDWWRRWNTHFRAFLVDLFFYPVALRLRRKHPVLVLWLCTVSVFLVGSSFFHWVAQYYFEKNSLRSVDWGIVAENFAYVIIVGVGLSRERQSSLAKRKKAELSAPRRWVRRVATYHLIFLGTVVCGYGTTYLTTTRRAELFSAKVDESRALARQGRRKEAAEHMRSDLGALHSLVKDEPREPRRRLELAFVLSLDAADAHQSEIGGHLAIATAFLDEDDTRAKTLLFETLLVQGKEAPAKDLLHKNPHVATDWLALLAHYTEDTDATHQ